MKVRVLSGLNLKVQTDQAGLRGRYTVQTSYSQILSTKYQVWILHTYISTSVTIWQDFLAIYDNENVPNGKKCQSRFIFLPNDKQTLKKFHKEF